MDKREFAKTMALLSAAIDKPIGEQTLTAWFEILKDLPGDAVLAAVHYVIATDEYPTLPAVGKIRSAAIRLTEPERLTAAEAWGLVIKAITGYGHTREKEALTALPEEAAEAARLMGWQQMCHADNVEVIRGQFLKIYENQAARARDRKLIPPQTRQLQQLIRSTAENLSLPEGATEREEKRTDSAT